MKSNKNLLHIVYFYASFFFWSRRKKRNKQIKMCCLLLSYNIIWSLRKSLLQKSEFVWTCCLQKKRELGFKNEGIKAKRWWRREIQNRRKKICFGSRSLENFLIFCNFFSRIFIVAECEYIRDKVHQKRLFFSCYVKIISVFEKYIMKNF